MDPTFSFLIPPSTATNPAAYVPQPGFPFTTSNLKDVAPRVGFSYRVTDKIVVRGGGGINYNANHLNAYTLTSSNYPFSASVVYTSPNPLKQIATNPYVTLNNPSPGSGTASPVAGTPGTYVSAYSVQNPPAIGDDVSMERYQRHRALEKCWAWQVQYLVFSHHSPRRELWT